MSEDRRMSRAEPVVAVEVFRGFEIEADSKEAMAEVAAMLDAEIDENMREGLFNQLKAGYYLHVMKESGAWKALGDHVKTWKDYVEKEKGISTGTDSDLRGIATEFGPVFVKHPELMRVEYKRLTELLTYFRRNREKLDKYLDKNKIKAITSLTAPETEQGSPPEDIEDGPVNEVIDAELVDEEGPEQLEQEDVEPDEDIVKVEFLSAAQMLPKKGWQSLLREIKGEDAADGCACDGEYDVLHRCRACGQVFSPTRDGSCEEFTELMELSGVSLLGEYKKAVLSVSSQKSAATESWYEKKGDKFFVRRGLKSEGGVWYTDMKPVEYSKEGMANLVIEERTRRVEQKKSQA